MESTITAVAIIVVLSLWHLRNRRHPGWLASDDGRFYIQCGYPLVAVAAYALVDAPTATTWEWAIGNLWALAAMVAFVSGFEALNRATTVHAERSQAFEAVSLEEAATPHRDQPPTATR
ncbi:hypothetical protein [Mycolicibacterium austroafricanum]|uniref:hypothetical protein n=1 Tax=Mycolicibacterium austroafricanum TaxID=39687 RepID=UPI001CA31CAF|nr:hypothetical protein [Mycolicibacterium austroafricanum]QZT63688.1 hypothetical protein JN085_04730 [Mycolicibacterium austroafricanum]